MTDQRNTLTNQIKLIFIRPLFNLPPIPLELLAFSIVGSFVFTLALSFLGSQVSQDTIWTNRNPVLDKLTSLLFLDPFLWIIITTMITSILIYNYTKQIPKIDQLSRLISILLPFFIIVTILLIGDFLLKPAFAIERPSNQLSEPPLTAAVEEFLSRNSSPDSPNSMPSGFVMRQMAAFLFALWLIRKSNLSKFKNLILQMIVAFGLIIVSFSRVYRGAHTLYDVAVAIGLGTIFFWILLLTPYYLFSIENKHIIDRVYLSTLIIGTMVLYLVTLGYSTEAAALTKFFSIIFMILGTIYIIRPVIELPGEIVDSIHNN